jgi:hypothetical protein
VEITLPASYEFDYAQKDLEILVEALKTMSEEYSEDIQELNDNNKDDVILWGYDTDSPSSHQTSLLVMKNEEFTGMSLVIISTALFQQTSFIPGLLIGKSSKFLAAIRLSLSTKRNPC